MTDLEKWEKKIQGCLSRVMDNLEEMLLIIDGNLTGAGPRVIKVNSRFLQFFGFSSEDLRGRHLAELTAADRQQLVEKITESVRTDGNVWKRLSFFDAGGEVREVNCSFNFLEDDRERLFVLVQEEKSRLRYLAYHDVLTDLPNRQLFYDRLDQAIKRARRQDEKLGLIYADLDGFGSINDRFGHQQGDYCLREIARRLRSCIRRSDTAARIGGDEFSFLLSDIKSRNNLRPVADKICETVEKPLEIGDEEIKVSASLGAVVYPDITGGPEQLVDCADEAMYRSKKQGGSRLSFYDFKARERQKNLANGASAGKENKARLTLRRALEKGLEKNQFVLYYQPLIRAQTNEIISVESLLRWKKTEKEILKPDNFIDRAGLVGVMSKIEEWVVARLCNRLGSWQQRFESCLPTSMNISGELLTHRKLSEIIPRIIRNSEMDPSLLEIEISELDALRDVETTQNKLEELRDLGVRVSIDDFGQGLSSLHYLSSLPVQKIKLSRSVVRDIPQVSSSVRIATAVIEAAHSLGQEVVPVGVETEEQLRFFKDKNCKFIQGNYFSAPLTEEELISYLKNNNSDQNSRRIISHSAA
ncbi:MAG: putative bifunctional diguanylate cyclase/phosphodiesterase [bacterium]